MIDCATTITTNIYSLYQSTGVYLAGRLSRAPKVAYHVLMRTCVHNKILLPMYMRGSCLTVWQKESDCT